MTTPIWQPSVDKIKNSNISRFIKFVNTCYSVNISNYQELYIWSITKPKEFWPAVWHFCNIIASQLWQKVLSDPSSMMGNKWFIGSKLNFAENLLRYYDKKPALIYYDEDGKQGEISYYDLRIQVAQLAQALKQAGITVNDRVAGLMPNIPETVIAMLATVSIGAIWSSCSLDFGLQGVCDRFQQISPKILFTTDSHTYNGKLFNNLEKIAKLQSLIPSIIKTVIIPSKSFNPVNGLKNTICYDNFLAKEATTIQFEQLAFDHPIYILYSSGTTGEPKCIVHGAGNTLIQHLKELVLHTDLKPIDTIFYYTTCGWMMWNWLVSSLATGASIILYNGSPFYPRPSVLFDVIDQENVSIFGTSAKFISAAEKLFLEPRKSHKLSKLHTILSTGSPLLPMNYDYIYQKVKHDVQLSSISGGTDIVSCFALGNPLLPVYKNELQCKGLGMKVEVFDENGNSIKQQKGELVCTAPFPSMPIYFWNDSNNEKYFNAYFKKFPNVWCHGDYAEITEHEGIIIYGRSDAILNPGGIRIGTAEIYRQVEQIEEIKESIVIGQEWQNDIRIILFVVLQNSFELSDELKNKIKKLIRENASPHHVPEKIIQVPDIPRTLSGKIVELAIRDIIHAKPIENIHSLANPEALKYFENIEELKDK